jgi:hypothetical protein
MVMPMSERDDDDAITRQRTLVANAEEMAREHSARRETREHSARREIRMREDRVRHLGSEAAEGAPPPKRPRAVEARPTAPEAPPDGDKKPRLSDPFPPLSEKRAPTRADAKKPNSPEGHTDARSGAHEPTRPRANQPVAASGSAVDELALEIEDLLRRSRIGWSAMESADRVTIIAALGTLIGVFTPWVSTPTRPFSLGIVEGGVVHGALAVAAIALALGRGKDAAHGSSRTVDRTARRASLFHVLLGALSTVVGAALLVYWGFVKSPTHPIDVHLGFYWTLAMGTGLSYGGFARFGSRREP